MNWFMHIPNSVSSRWAPRIRSFHKIGVMTGGKKNPVSVCHSLKAWLIYSHICQIMFADWMYFLRTPQLPGGLHTLITFVQRGMLSLVCTKGNAVFFITLIFCLFKFQQQLSLPNNRILIAQKMRKQRQMQCMLAIYAESVFQHLDRGDI